MIMALAIEHAAVVRRRNNSLGEAPSSLTAHGSRGESHRRPKQPDAAARGAAGKPADSDGRLRAVFVAAWRNGHINGCRAKPTIELT